MVLALCVRIKDDELGTFGCDFCTKPTKDWNEKNEEKNTDESVLHKEKKCYGFYRVFG